MKHVRHIRTPSGFLRVLQQGDDVLALLGALMQTENVHSASVMGFGFVAKARFGFFDFERRDYKPRDYTDLEVTGFTGTLAWMNGKPAIHAHASGADRSFKLVGGQVLDLIVGRGSFEITIIEHPHRLERAMEPALGAKVLQLGTVA